MSQETLDSWLPPLEDGDRSTLYLGIRTVHGSTRVLFCRIDGEEGFLRDPLRGEPSTDNTFDWGAEAAHLDRPRNPVAAVGLARALLLDATGGDAGVEPLPPGAPDVEAATLDLYENLVRRLGEDEWELRASQVRTWVLRWRSTPRPASSGDLSEGGGA